MISEVEIPTEMWRQIATHAEREYPRECCGIILAPIDDPDRLSGLFPCTNTQDRQHAMDPDQFPRTSANAYFIEPGELLAIERRCRQTQSVIRLIYHSHPDADAYFSVEDNKRATFEGGPLIPTASYLVLSVKAGIIDHHKTFHWQPGTGYRSSSGEPARSRPD
jgi:[CysO sulfur-carrier protein]-S-L-cysteine hydrolase